MNLMNKLFILCFFLMSTISFSQVSQSIIAAKWKDGKYDWYNNKNSNNWTSKPEFVQDGQTEISFKKNEKGEVSEVTLSGKKYLPDNNGVSTYVRYFRTTTESGRCLFFTDGCIEVYVMDKNEVPLNTRYIASIGKAGSKKGYDNFIAHLEKSKSNVANDVALFEKNKSENTIEDKHKEIAKIEAVMIPKNGGGLKSGDKFALGFITTFKDGKVIKTKNLGGLHDIKEYSYRIYFPMENEKNMYPIGTDLIDSIAPYCDYLQGGKMRISIDTKKGSHYITGLDLEFDNCSLDPSPEGVLFRTAGEKYNDLIIIPNKDPKWGSYHLNKHEKFGFFLQRSELDRDFDFEKLVEAGGFVIGEKNNEYFFLNFDGTLKDNQVFDELTWLGEVTDYLFYKNSKLVKAKKNGKYGIFDSNLKIILPVEYDMIKFAEKDRIIITKNGKSALMNSQTMEMPGDFYDEIVLSGNREQYRVKLNGKYGYIDKDGKITLELKYDWLGQFSNRYATARLGSRNFYLNTAFTVKLDNGYKQINGFSIKTVTWNGKQRDLIYAEIIDENGEAKIIDDYGNTLTDKDFESNDVPSVSSSSNSSSSSSSSTTKASTSCFILNDLTQDQMGGKNSIKLGFTGFRLATSSIARGKTMEVDCDDVWVYRLKNENSSERAKGYDLFNTKGKCGETIKLSDFW